MYIVSGIGERHILSVFHEIINIILFYIDRCFNLLSCATRKIRKIPEIILPAYERPQEKASTLENPF